jgi:hypothetical protein
VSEAGDWAAASSAHSAAVADDGNIALVAVVGMDIVLAAAGSWDIGDMAALPAVMEIPVAAEMAAAAVVAGTVD